MSVIIRLQNLPWSANSLDIRHYFRGLSIPEGGVHIVGGEMGDAFIAFSTDEDARQAMMLAGGKIKEVQISLMLSSRSEMQKIIEAARQASMSNSLAHILGPSGVPPPSVVGLNQACVAKDRKGEKKDLSSDLPLTGHETGRMDRRDRKEKSRSRSRDRGRKDRRDRDRDRDRDRRRRSRSRSKSRDRRRRRSRSRSKGRDVISRDRDKKDLKDNLRKDEKMNIGPPILEPGTNVPNMDILSPNTWNVMQTGALAQNAQLLTNFELLRNLANQKGPLLPGGPATLLPPPLGIENDGNPDIFLNRRNSPQQNDFGNRNKGNQRGFKNFEEKHFHDVNAFGGDGRFDRNQNQKNFQNFGPGFSMRNGNEAVNNPRFGNFGRVDNGFLSRGPGNNRDRPNMSRGLLDLPMGMHQRDRFGNRDDRVDEFGRSIQLRNRKNLANEDGFKDDGLGGMDQQNFPGFQNRFGKNQQNQRPPALLRGRDNWGSGRGNEGFQDRRGGGFRGSYDDSNRNFRSKNRELAKHHEDGGEPSSKSSEKDSCVEIRDLPPQIAYGEVRRPFSNLKLIIKEIKFFDYTPQDKKCRIKFLNSENKKKAIQLSNKILIDNKEVHLLHITDGDFDECVDEGVKRPEVKFSDDEDDSELSSRDVYVQIKDLPADAEEADIFDLFPNVSLEKILLEDIADGKKKIAYVKFEKAVDAKVALGMPTRNVNDSTVSVVVLSQYAFNEHLNKGKTDGGESAEMMEVDQVKPEAGEEKGKEGDEKGDEGKEKQSADDGKKLTCILMKNLPPEASDRDICDFFSDIGLVPNKIHLMLDMAGQASGDAFCEFSDSNQVEKATTKNSAHLGKNVVDVFAVPRSEMLETLGLPPGPFPAKPSDPAENFGRPQCVVALENIPFRAGNFDIINFFGWSYNLTEKDILRRYNEKGQPTGDGKVCFKSPEDALRAIRFLNNRSLMGRVIRMKLL